MCSGDLVFKVPLSHFPGRRNAQLHNIPLNFYRKQQEVVKKEAMVKVAQVSLSGGSRRPLAWRQPWMRCRMERNDCPLPWLMKHSAVVIFRHFKCIKGSPSSAEGKSRKKEHKFKQQFLL